MAPESTIQLTYDNDADASKSTSPTLKDSAKATTEALYRKIGTFQQTIIFPRRSALEYHSRDGG